MPNATLVSRVATPATFADLVNNASLSTGAVKADNDAIAAAQAALVSDTATAQADTAALTSEVQVGGLRYVTNADGTATIYELNQAGQVTPRTAQNAAVPLTPVPDPTPAPAPEPAPAPQPQPAPAS